MKFRQRIAWITVIMYLGGTFAFFYYMFEINEHYNQFAVDHVQRYHSTVTGQQHDSQNIFSNFYGHVTDIPLPVWLLIFLLPYLQIFMMILACTRAEPRHSLAYLWPGIVYMKYQKLFRGHKSSLTHTQLTPMVTLNGHSNNHIVIHT